MTDKFNTIAGWVLFAGIVALGGTVVTHELFKSERPEEGGYPIEGVIDPDNPGPVDDKPIEFYLASADATKGEAVFKKCAACHNADKGGPNALGPNLYGTMGKPHGHVPGFAYTDALKGKPDNWDWKSMSDWLANPKKYAPGTKMTFAGLSNPEDRANVIAFLNSRSDSPLPLPAAPAAGAAAEPEAQAGDNQAGDGTNDGAQKAENEPVLTEQQAAQSPNKNAGGQGAANVTGPSGVAKKD